LDESDQTRPSEAGLGPEQVVLEVLAACRQSASAAATALWRFGSPRLRRSAGGQDHLTRHLSNELFRPLIGYLELSRRPIERLDDAARQIVVVVSAEGERVAFLFALARARQGDRAGRWLVTGLERA
jgi:hypothetical protein